MYAFELFEAGKPRVVVTYPGRFQPFHQGHAAVFAQLQKKFGRDNVYILTSNDTSSAKSPFNFSDKYQLMTAAGVPGDKIIETNNMYVLPDGFDPASTIFVTAVGEPDKKRLNPDTFIKKDKKDAEGNIIKPAGSASYFKTFESPENKATADQHGYVIVIPEVKKNIKIGGKVYDVSHGTECRNLWNAVRGDQQQRIEFLTQLYGSADPELGRIFDKIPTTTAEDISPASQDSTSPITGVVEDAAGVGVVAKNKKMAKDPRYSMSITKDVKPSTPKNMLRAFRLSEEFAARINPEDFEIKNFDKLDNILVKLCEMVVEGKKTNGKVFGMVAACVLDPNNQFAFGINYLDEASGKRIHAERAAIDSYVAEHGQIPAGSIIITTLSPCSHPMDDRYGDSCADLISGTDVHKVYCGYKDPTQEADTAKTFHTMQTRNPAIVKMCKTFAKTFLGNVVKEDKDSNNINEKDMMSMVKKFLPLAMNELKIKKLPRIIIQSHITTHDGQATFGRFVDEDETIYLGIADRHPVDILRTLAHELVHFKQSIDGKMYDGAGETGSPIENEAHVKAGIIMRHFNKKYPNAIQSQELDIK